MAVISTSAILGGAALYGAGAGLGLAGAGLASLAAAGLATGAAVGGDIKATGRAEKAQKAQKAEAEADTLRRNQAQETSRLRRERVATRRKRKAALTSDSQEAIGGATIGGSATIG